MSLRTVALSAAAVSLLAGSNAAAQTAPRQNPGQNLGQNPQVRPAQAGPRQLTPPVRQPIAPFQLTAAQADYLNRVLAHWQARCNNIQQLSTTFVLFEYDQTFGKKKEYLGELKYKAPDKGVYFVKPDEDSNFPGEHWYCDGKSVFEKDYRNKRIVERILPPELQGAGIADSPLPFLFNQTADKLKQRYWLRVNTPRDVSDEVWLEAFPKFQNDAANFGKVQAILKVHEEQLHLFALKVYLPGGRNEKVYVFPHPDPVERKKHPKQKVEVNANKLFDFGGFKPWTPPGWKKVVEEAPANPPQTATRPGATTRQR